VSIQYYSTKNHGALPGTPYQVQYYQVLVYRTKVDRTWYSQNTKNHGELFGTEVVLYQVQYQQVVGLASKNKNSLLIFFFLLSSLLDTRLQPNSLIVIFVPCGLICFLLWIVLLNVIVFLFFFTTYLCADFCSFCCLHCTSLVDYQ